MRIIHGILFILLGFLLSPGKNIFAVEKEKINFDIALPMSKVQSIWTDRIIGNRIYPDLVSPQELKEKMLIHYKKLINKSKKDHFQKKLRSNLEALLLKRYEKDLACSFLAQFDKLVRDLFDNGAVVFAQMIKKESFQELIEKYQSVVKTSGAESWIHSYVNLGNHPEFLANSNFNNAFLHPLLIALISYQVGGPIRLVDARGKDAGRIRILAQDNMLHIDNTPFNDEYKIILTWKKGEPVGPQGQNFVYLPGTHKFVRKAQLSDDQVWSSENGSIFTRQEDIEKLFNLQKEIGFLQPTVVEVTHPLKPLTTVFAAGSLVHHRYRTDNEDASERSTIILAFHRSEDNPGQFVSEENVPDENIIYEYLFGRRVDEDGFINGLLVQIDDIIQILSSLGETNDLGCKVLKQKAITLDDHARNRWIESATSAPRVEEIKEKKVISKLGQTLTWQEFLDYIVFSMMKYDKHGPLDLILYSDAREEIRKWARNRIREMRIETLYNRTKEWSLVQPLEDHLLKPQQIVKYSHKMVEIIDGISVEDKRNVKIDRYEKISPNDAFRSLRQLMTDLAESFSRIGSKQEYLSTCLFLFLANDQLRILLSDENERLIKIGEKLLRNYVAVGILMEKDQRFTIN